MSSTESSEGSWLTRNSGTQLRPFIIQRPENTIRGTARLPENYEQACPCPLVFVQSGFGGGADVAKLIETRLPVVVAAIDFKLQKLSDLRKMTKSGQLPASLINMARKMQASLNWLKKSRYIDSNKLYVATVSFGTLSGLPVVSFRQDIRGIFVIQAGGNLKRLAQSHISQLRHLKIGKKALAAAARPFEPTLHAGYLSPAWLVLIANKNDSVFPEWSVRALYKSAPEPKKLIWDEHEHVGQHKIEVIKALTQIAEAELKKRL